MEKILDRMKFFIDGGRILDETKDRKEISRLKEYFRNDKIIEIVGVNGKLYYSENTEVLIDLKNNLMWKKNTQKIS